MSNPRNLFSDNEKNILIQAIKEAENRSSAEIRIHIENHCRGAVLDRATEVFQQLEMDKTVLRNGVLIYLAIKDRQVAIIGDQGINAFVEKDFWQQCYNVMVDHFTQNDFVGGIKAAIESFRDDLGKLFPHQPDDVNELNDDISWGN
jgi:uncharacterized membrane protein